MTSPAASKISRTMLFSSSPVSELPQKADMASPTLAAMLGITRTTARPVPSRDSMASRVLPAAMEMTSGRRRWRTGDSSGSTTGNTWGLTASTTASASPATSVPEEQMLTPHSSKSATILAESVSYIRMSLPRKPPPTIPRMMAPAMLPAPIKPIFIPYSSLFHDILIVPPSPSSVNKKVRRRTAAGRGADAARSIPHERIAGEKETIAGRPERKRAAAPVTGAGPDQRQRRSPRGG